MVLVACETYGPYTLHLDYLCAFLEQVSHTNTSKNKTIMPILQVDAINSQNLKNNEEHAANKLYLFISMQFHVIIS